MLHWTGGGFSVDPSAVAPVKTITFTTTQLLLECTRILDEEASGPIALPRAIERKEERAAEHFDRGLEAVHDKHYQDALREWELAVASEPENRLYQHNLRRLRALMTLGR